MKNRIFNLVKYFCRQLDFNEFISAMIILYEVQNGTRSDIELKRLRTDRPHYRKFMVDMVEPLDKPIKITKDWNELQKEYLKANEKTISIVRRRKDSTNPPKGSICQHCHAPARYLYINNGKHGTQLQCKICGGTSPTHRKRFGTSSELLCPYCGKSIFEWKKAKLFTAYKCSNNQCSHYIRNKNLLAEKEIDDLKKQPGLSSQFKLHYQFRIYHFNPSDIKVNRPTDGSGIDLTKIHNDMRTFSLVLTYYVCFGLSSRQTRDALRHTHGIKSVTHQTVINYIKAAAYQLYYFTDRNCPKPEGILSADETYIRIDDEWFYTWFGMDSKSRAICGYNVADSRDMEHALALLYDAIGKPEENSGKHFEMVADGNPSYDSAILAYTQKAKEASGEQHTVIEKHTVIGLENLDSESRDYRPIKQLVERLNRTYKFHTRPRSGFKNLEGAVALTVLFVTFYNFMRPHLGLKGKVPVKLGILKDIDIYPEMWIKLIQYA
jgi:putative transposase